MADPVIETFRQEFDRFHGLMLQQVDACPSDEVWLAKTGRFAYWQHLMHVFAVLDFYVGTDRAAPAHGFSEAIVKFQEEQSGPMTRDEIKALAETMKGVVYAFLKTQSAQTLTEKNEHMTAITGRESNNLNALIGLVRHYNYHIGCLDTILRQHTGVGVL